MQISDAVSVVAMLIAAVVDIVNKIFGAINGSVDYLLICVGIYFAATFLILPLRGYFVGFAGNKVSGGFQGSAKNQKKEKKGK